jgi:hypothetical protein
MPQQLYELGRSATHAAIFGLLNVWRIFVLDHKSRRSCRTDLHPANDLSPGALSRAGWTRCEINAPPVFQNCLASCMRTARSTYALP